MKGRSRLRCGVLILALMVLVNHPGIHSQDSEEEARRAHSAGSAALQNNDLAIAERNYIRAVELSPKNAQYRLDLAKVQDKLEKLGAANDNLQLALQIGLEGQAASEAADLRGEIDYKLQKTKMEAPLKKALGTWVLHGTYEWNGYPNCGNTGTEYYFQKVVLNEDGLKNEVLEGQVNIEINRRLICMGLPLTSTMNPDFRQSAQKRGTWKLSVASDGVLQIEIDWRCSGNCSNDEMSYHEVCSARIDGDQLFRTCGGKTIAFQRER